MVTLLSILPHLTSTTTGKGNKTSKPENYYVWSYMDFVNEIVGQMCLRGFCGAKVIIIHIHVNKNKDNCISLRKFLRILVKLGDSLVKITID